MDGLSRLFFLQEVEEKHRKDCVQCRLGRVCGIRDDIQRAQGRAAESVGADSPSSQSGDRG